MSCLSNNDSKCCVQSQKAIHDAESDVELSNTLLKWMACGGKAECVCCTQARELAKIPNLSNKYLKMLVNVFLKHHYQPSVEEIDLSTLLFVYVKQAAGTSSFIEAISQHAFYLQNFADYQANFLLTKIRNNLKDGFDSALTYDIFEKLMIHLSASKFSYWKKLKVIFEQLYLISSEIFGHEKAFTNIMKFYSKNVKVFYLVTAALVEHIPFELFKKQFNAFTKRLKYCLQSHELSSVSKDLFIAVAKRSEKSKETRSKFFTFCKNVFGNHSSLIRRRSTCVWLPSFIQTLPNLVLALLASVKTNYANSDLHKPMNAKYVYRNPWVPCEKYAFIWLSICFYRRRNDPETYHLACCYISSRNDDLSFMANEYFSSHYDSARSSTSLAQTYLDFSKAKYVKDYQPVDSSKCDQSLADNLTNLLEKCDALLRDVGSPCIGSMVSVPSVRNKFLELAWQNNPYGDCMEVENQAKRFNKEMFETPLFDMMRAMADKDMSKSTNFCKAINGLYDIILRLGDKKVTTTGVGLLNAVIARSKHYDHFDESLLNIFQAFSISFKQFLINPKLSIRCYSLFHVLDFFLQQTKHLMSNEVVLVYLLNAWSGKMIAVSEDDHAIDFNVERSTDCVIRCSKILNFVIRSTSYDLSQHYDAIFAQILECYDQIDSEIEFPTRPHLARLAATIFGRLFSQHPVMIPLYDFLKDDMQTKIFKIFADKFLDNHENYFALTFFCHIAVINENYYSNEIRLILNGMRKKFCKQSRNYSLRSAMRVVIQNFGDAACNRRVNDLFQIKSSLTRKVQPFKKYAFNNKEDALKFLIDTVFSCDIEKLRDAAYYSISNQDSFQSTEDQWFIKLVGLILFGNHENDDLANIVCSCSTEFDNAFGTYLLGANATLINAVFKSHKEFPGLFHEVAKALQENLKALNEANFTFDWMNFLSTISSQILNCMQ